MEDKAKAILAQTFISVKDYSKRRYAKLTVTNTDPPTQEKVMP